MLQAHCPQIEDLAVVYGRQLNNPHLDKCDPALSAILFACSHPHVDDTFGEDDDTIIEEPIEPTMGLQRLRLDALVLPPAQSHALMMLLDYHSGSLTHLGISDCRNLQKKGSRTTLLKILRSFGQLQEVHLLPSGEVEYVEEDHVVDAQALINSLTTPTQYTSAATMTWACASSLRILRMMIGGLGTSSSYASRPTSHNMTGAFMDRTTTTTPSSDKRKEKTVDQDLQRQIYRFLGSLTHLQELCLGFGSENENENKYKDQKSEATKDLKKSIFTLPDHQAHQQDCLEFSLDSGLHLLGGLQSLRVLNVARMNHRIRLAEIQWMCRAWPRLELIEGLLKIKSLERLNTSSDYNMDAVGPSQALWGGQRREEEEEEEVVSWIKEHHPRLRFT